MTFHPPESRKKKQTVDSVVVYRLVFIGVLFVRYPRWLSIHIAVLVVETHQNAVLGAEVQSAVVSS